MAGGRFTDIHTDVVLHSLKNQHQERATKACGQSVEVAAAFGTEILGFHEIPTEYEYNSVLFACWNNENFNMFV